MAEISFSSLSFGNMGLMGRRTLEICAKNPSGVPFNTAAMIVLLGSALRRQVYPAAQVERLTGDGRWNGAAQGSDGGHGYLLRRVLVGAGVASGHHVGF